MTETNEIPTTTSTAVTVKQRRIRLPAPRKQLARVMQRLERVITQHESGEQTLKQGTVVNVLLVQARLALALHKDSVSREARTLREARKAQRSAGREVEQTPEPPDEDVRRMTADWGH